MMATVFVDGVNGMSVLGLAAGAGHTSPGLALLFQAGGAATGDYGPWSAIISILQGLLLAAGGLGVVVGLAVKSAAPINSEAQEAGNRILAGSIVGFMFGALGVPLYDLIVGWTS